jgi:hypothetical protein
MEKWGYSSTILDLDTRRRGMVSFIHLPLNHCGNWKELERRLGGLQNRSGLYGEENDLLPRREQNPR